MQNDRTHSKNKVALAVSSVLHEFEWKNISSPKELASAVIVEAILFAALKASINRMIKTSRVDRDLSREINSIVKTGQYTVRLLGDERVFTFENANVIWVTTGIVKLLTREELIAVLLHEVGHGDDKKKILFDKLTKRSSNPKKYRILLSMVGVVLKSQGYEVKSDPSMSMRVYMLAYIIYSSLIGYPFDGLYRWSYSDLAIQHGYWDEYENALRKISRYAQKQKPSKLASKIGNMEDKYPGASQELQRDLQQTATDDSDNLDYHLNNLTKNKQQKPDRSFVSKFLRSIF